MRTERLKLAAVGAVAMFGLGTVAANCSPVRPVSVAAPAAHGGRTSIVRPDIVPTPTPTPTPAPAPAPAPATAVPAVRAAAPPRPAHIVIVLGAPYVASLRSGGASFPNAYAVRQSDIAGGGIRALSGLPTTFDRLPAVSWVAPAAVKRSDLRAYAKWATTHRSLLIVTFAGQPPLVVYGERVKPGAYPAKVDAYSVLRLVQSLSGTPCRAKWCAAKPIAGIWR